MRWVFSKMSNETLLMVLKTRMIGVMSDSMFEAQTWKAFQWPKIGWFLHLKREWLQGTSLVAQWLRIRLPMQGTQVRALVWEDPTCCRPTKTKPVCHNYWACALEPASHNYWTPRARSPWFATREATSLSSLCTAAKSSPHSPQLEKARVQQQRSNAAIIN